MDGTGFPAGTPTRNRLEIDYAGVDVVGFNLPGPDTSVTAEVSLGFRYLEVEIHMKGGGGRESQQITEGWIHVAGRVEWSPHPAVGISLGVGLGLEGNDVVGEAVGGLSAGWGAVRLEIGYRVFSVDDNDHEGDQRNDLAMLLAGPYAGLHVRF